MTCELFKNLNNLTPITNYTLNYGIFDSSSFKINSKATDPNYEYCGVVPYIKPLTIY